MSRESFGRKSDEQAREAVASILAIDVSDPRVALVTVTGAKVSPDRSYLDVYVSADPGRYDDTLAGLESAKGRVRTLVG
ncbi:MAG: ribosome-binding factor A, partial [Actinobacteria bacterium]